MAERYRIGIRLPGWAKGFGNRMFRGILDFIRENHPLEIDFEQASSDDLEPLRIDGDWRGDGLLVFRHSEEEAREWRRPAPGKGPRVAR